MNSICGTCHDESDISTLNLYRHHFAACVMWANSARQHQFYQKGELLEIEKNVKSRTVLVRRKIQVKRYKI